MSLQNEHPALTAYFEEKIQAAKAKSFKNRIAVEAE